ncbi:hypothetical protein D7X33_47080, partial [Butyricicoccus sp. 1XD8-22]
FVLVANSTIIQECVSLCIPIFIYDIHPSVESISGNLSTRFENLDSLLRIISLLQCQEKFDNLKREYFQNMMGYFGGFISKEIVFNNYKNEIQNFIDK